MDTLTSPPIPTAPPAPSRRSAWKRLLRALGLLVLVIALGVGLVYQRQIVSWLSHTVGPPKAKEAFVPLPPAAQPEVRLAVVGDVGDGGDLEWRLAATMYAAGRNDYFDALVLLGDNVYPYGDPSRLDEFVFRPFSAVLDSGAVLYSITGNHDAMADDAGLAQLQALGMTGFWWSERIGDVLLVGLDGNQPGNPDQLAFLEATLAGSDAPWKIVAVHQPPYSAGYQGSDREVRAAFTPLFERHGVQLVLSGHEHDYQRSMPINGVTYLVSGGGAGTRRTGRADFTDYSASTMNFVDLNVYSDRILLRAIDHEFMVFDEFTIDR